MLPDVNTNSAVSPPSVMASLETPLTVMKSPALHRKGIEDSSGVPKEVFVFNELVPTSAKPSPWAAYGITSFFSQDAAARKSAATKIVLNIFFIAIRF